ncbi:copper resistance system multicopper oxidase [Acinetobacter puyangensis]|uniref:copper resistance system multicopper oxidase n=1 Tax=Acinetobacter puyangensis TaxID=1096779 RepID=UPI003A4D2610
MQNKFLSMLMAIYCLCMAQWSWSAVREYYLTIAEQSINITGQATKKITVNGQFPAPTLFFEEGDDAVIVVHNQLKNQDSSIHWHGLLLPGLMDGVPGFNQFQGIKPQGEFTYRFKIRQNGTYWYHAHSKGQEQDGLYGAFIVYPKGKIPLSHDEHSEQDQIVMLSDFHLSSGESIMNNLKKSADYYQNQRETLFDVLRQVKQKGMAGTWQDRKMWNQMRMLKTDLSDVTGYTFLVNGQTPEQNWTSRFNAGEKIRLRFINASAMSFFDVRIPGLKMTVVSADGQAVQPIAVDEFRIGTAETYDVIVAPQDTQYQIQAESIDRSGFALATLLQNNSTAKTLATPQHRPRALLSMQDMPMPNMQHDAEDHSQHLASIENQTGDQQTVESSENMHQMHAQMHQNGEHSHDLSNMGMMHDHMSSMSEPSSPHTHDLNQNIQQTPNHTHAVEAKTGTTQQQLTVEGWANASTPQGHKALHYADLKALHSQSDIRAPEREIVIHLSGSMERYIWTMNGDKFNQAKPIQVKYGERIRLKFINDSMMAHPMHLHGMFVQLENGQAAQDLPNKHTLIIPPNQTVTALLTADELGEWAIHCHLLYHMTAGMMNKLIVANVASTEIEPTAHSDMNQGDHHAHH